MNEIFYFSMGAELLTVILDDPDGQDWSKWYDDDVVYCKWMDFAYWWSCIREGLLPIGPPPSSVKGLKKLDQTTGKSA